MPDLSMMQSAPGPETVIDGVRYLYFGGTSYLGLAAHPEVIEAGCAALRQFGVHSATSRGRFGTTPPVRLVEERAAAFFGVEDAFYFGTGYVSNHILVAAVGDEIDAVLIDDSSHYSLREAALLPGRPLLTFRRGDAADMAEKAAGFSRVLVMADAVGPSDGALAPVESYLDALESRDQATLLLDDAHGFGVLGPHGRGLLDDLGRWTEANGQPGKRAVRLVVGGTLAKALGGFGGIIPGTADFVERARRSSHYFDGASAPASAVAGSSAKALEIIMREPELRQRLQDNGARLREGLRSLGLTPPAGRAAHLGITTGSAANMRHIHEALKERGILLPYVATYSGLPPEGNLRFSVFATHTAEQIDRLLAELRALL